MIYHFSNISMNIKYIFYFVKILIFVLPICKYIWHNRRGNSLTVCEDSGQRYTPAKSASRKSASATETPWTRHTSNVDSHSLLKCYTADIHKIQLSTVTKFSYLLRMWQMIVGGTYNVIRVTDTITRKGVRLIIPIYITFQVWSCWLHTFNTTHPSLLG